MLDVGSRILAQLIKPLLAMAGHWTRALDRISDALLLSPSLQMLPEMQHKMAHALANLFFFLRKIS